MSESFNPYTRRSDSPRFHFMKCFLHFLQRAKATRRIFPALTAVGMLLCLQGCNLIGGALYTALSLAPIKLMFSCLPEGTQVDTPDGTVAVESLKPGDKVIGYSGKPVLIQQIHAYDEDEEAAKFLTVEFEERCQGRSLRNAPNRWDSIKKSSTRRYDFRQSQGQVDHLLHRGGTIL